MYLPRVFHADDTALVHEIVDRFSFATLMCIHDEAILVAHAPLILDREVGRLRGHLARANPVAKALERRSRMTAEFRGPDAYVSPTWYEHPSRQVPTWNYVVVHAVGPAEPLSDHELEQLLIDLSTRHEGARDTVWRPSDLDAEFVRQLQREIVGFSIRVESLEAKLKLSQNRSPEDRSRVRAAFERSGDPAAISLGALMQRLE
jgi:transcriptional regulator